VFLMAPATTDLIGKVASGIATDAVSSLALSVPRDTPRYVAPAMAPDMFNHQATQKNLSQLREWNYHIIAPVDGLLADGVRGVGKMAEPETIAQAIVGHLRPSTTASTLRTMSAAGNGEAIRLFRQAVEMYNASVQAGQNRIPELMPEDELYGLRSQITSRAILVVLNNIDSLVKEKYKSALIVRDASGAPVQGPQLFPTVAFLTAHIAERLAGLGPPRS
jgi:hypothetical protein